MKIRNLLDKIEREYGVENFFYNHSENNKDILVFAYKGEDVDIHRAVITKYDEKDSTASLLGDVDVIKIKKKDFVTKRIYFNNLVGEPIRKVLTEMEKAHNAIDYIWEISWKDDKEIIKIYMLSEKRLYKYYASISKEDKFNYLETTVGLIIEDDELEADDILYNIEELINGGSYSQIKTFMPVLTKHLNEVLIRDLK